MCILQLSGAMGVNLLVECSSGKVNIVWELWVIGSGAEAIEKEGDLSKNYKEKCSSGVLNRRKSC